MFGLGVTWALVFSLPFLVLVWDRERWLVPVFTFLRVLFSKGKDKNANKSQNSTFVDLDYTMTVNNCQRYFF